MTDTSGEQQPSFDHFELQKPLREAIDRLGFEFCTPIQAQSLVHTLAGHDVTGKAQTGTGKTAAFLITIINDLLSNPIEEKRYLAEPRALVVAPTRELAIQIASDAAKLTACCDLHTVTLWAEKTIRNKTGRWMPSRLISWLRLPGDCWISCPMTIYTWALLSCWCWMKLTACLIWDSFRRCVRLWPERQERLSANPPVQRNLYP